MDTDFVIPIILDNLKDKDALSLPHYTASCLFVMGEIVLYSTGKYSSINNHLPNILELVVGSDYLNSDSVGVLEAVLMLLKNVIKSCGGECQRYKRDLFKILLQLGSVPGTAHMHGEVELTITMLAKACGLNTSSELFSMELADLLAEMKETYMIWDENSSDRFVFGLLCRKSNEAVVEYWELILEIVGMNCTHEKAYNLRMDMLGLIEHFLSKESLQDTLQYYGEVIIRGVLQPCIEWRSGMPNVKIREAAIICLKQLLDNKLISEEDFQRNFKDLLNNLKNCLDDDFSSDIRFASIVLVKVMIKYAGKHFEWDDYKEVYPELLKRLDDSQDGIRLEACKALEFFFEAVSKEWAENLFEYMIQNIYIHLDDSEEQIQAAISQVLKKAAEKHPRMVIEIGSAMSAKFKHQVVAENLLNDIKQLHS